MSGCRALHARIRIPESDHHCPQTRDCALVVVQNLADTLQRTLAANMSGCVDAFIGSGAGAVTNANCDVTLRSSTSNTSTNLS